MANRERKSAATLTVVPHRDIPWEGSPPTLPLRRCLGDLVESADPRFRCDTRISTAWNVFLDGALHWVTVVDDDGRPVGVLMRADLAEAVLDDAPTIPAVLIGELTRPGRDRRPRQEATARDLMKPFVTTLSASCSLEDAAAALEAAELSEIVVVDEGGRMLGVVAADDLVPFLPPGPRRWFARRRPMGGTGSVVRR